jgi:hypothetical protein
MKNNQEKILIFLAFLPIIIFPISLPLSLILAVGLFVYSITIIEDKPALKKILTPLAALLLIGAILGTVNIFFSLVHSVGDFFNNYNWSGFKDVMDTIHNILKLIFSATLYTFSILTLLSYFDDKNVFILSNLVEKVMNSDFNFKKAKQEDTRPFKPELKKNDDDDKGDDDNDDDNEENNQD